MKKCIGAGMVACVFAVATYPGAKAEAADPIRIGFLSTFSGPEGVLGNELADGFKLALAETGNKLGGRPVQVVYADDQAKPDIGRQATDKMIEQDKVQLLTGINFSNVMLAVAKPALDAGLFVVSVNSGPSQYAGKQCNPRFFAVAFQNDTLFESVGAYFAEQKLDDAYLIAPNYPAGRDMLTGFKRYYKGKVAGETYTSFGALDYAGTISEIRAKAPKSVMFFLPGGMGINFIKQYDQSGLKSQIPLVTGTGSVDQTTLQAMGKTADGIREVVMWSEELDNPASKAFTAAFEKTYNRIPSPYAAQAYDTARLIDAALTSIDGKIEDKPAFQKALEAAKFDSVRGKFSFNTNHFPIQNFYLVEIVDNAQGKPYGKLKGTVVEGLKDSYAVECKMPAAD